MRKRKAAGKVGAVVETRKRRKTSPSNDRNKQKNDPLIERKVTRRSAKAAQEQAQAQNPPVEDGRIIPHPLLMDHILDKVFQHIVGAAFPATGPPKTDKFLEVCNGVQNIRLVCKQWKETVTRLYRRTRPPLRFGVVNPIKKEKCSDSMMERFLDIMKTTALIPVQRYAINATFFIKENQKLMKDFMRICGPEATELRLYFDNSSSMNFTRRSFPNLNLSKLKTLSFKCEYFRGKSLSNQTHDIPYLIEVLMTAADGLNEFRFEFATRDGKWQSTVVKRFGEVICKHIPKTVKILRLDMPLYDLHLSILEESKLMLEEFQFDCHCVADRETVRKFFVKQVKTLKVLRIFGGRPASQPSLKFPPRFEELMNMELQGTNIEPFSFRDTFPKLITLNIANWKTETTCVELLSCAKKALSIKEIYLPYRFSQAPLVRRAINCFPNIKKLHISPSPDIAETLQEVFIYFPEVEELYISFPFLLDNELNADSIFSGVSENDCRRIMKHRNFDNVNLKDVQHKPSITNLTKLRKLVLNDSACDVMLTDFAAHFVFLKMESLSELHTSRFRMSTKYVDLLREKLTIKLAEDDFSDIASDDSMDGWTSDDDEEDLHILPFLGLGFLFF